MCKLKLKLMIFTLILSSFFVFSQDKIFFLNEDFDSLREWKFLYFPVIKRHTKYSIDKDNDNSYIIIKSDDSSSALEYTKEFSVYEYPIMEWRWKIDNVYKKGDATKKSGDDYPIRVYIIFKFDYSKMNAFEKIKYNAIKGIAKKLYGQYPPHSTLNYIWSNKYFKEDMLKSSYFPKTSRMILLEKGNKEIGVWKTEKVNIIEDYKKYFGDEPPKKALIAISSDSDNTHEKATSYIDYIKIYRE